MVDHVTPLRNRRRYTKRQKVAAVVAAELSTVQAAAEETGIPVSTIWYWFDDPAFAEVRSKTREAIAPEATAIAHLLLGKIRDRIDQFEPRDLAITFGIMVDKSQLLSGEATSRTESRDVTGNLGDHERQALADAVDAWLRETADVDASP